MIQSVALRIRLLGGFEVEVGSLPVSSSAWRRRKAAALVKLLALAPHHRLHREQILETLWPELPPSAAKNNLHRTLHVARHVLEPDLRPGAPPTYLCLHGETLVLAPSAPVWVDVTAFARAADVASATRSSAAYEAALRLYHGDLLPDDRYEDWASGRREELGRLRLELLLELAKLQHEQGDDNASIVTFQGVVASQPTHEEAHLELMRLYLAAGRRGDAVRLFGQLRETLRSAFDVDPAEVTQSLYDSILVGDAPITASIEASEVEAAGSALLPATAGAPSPWRTNLPLHLTTFIGRERELAEIEELLGATRLLTLLGPGGSGKTRLAVEVATRLPASYPDGVWWLELAAIEDATLVSEVLAHSLGLVPTVDRSAPELLRAYLRSRELLLVLDNCEHLVDASARLAVALLQDCPGLRVLATSRTALNAEGEQTWVVPSLAVPDLGRLPPPERLAEYAAVRLFLDRAHAVRPDLEVTPSVAPAIAQICARLEGMPLAIELAAARANVLAPDQIAARLEDSLGLLGRGGRTVAPRHQTMRSVLDWSFDLLAVDEQVVFRRLSVFAGGWTLEAAEAVVVGEGGDSVLDRLSALVDHSLVVADEHNRTRRYRFLETIRQYAAEKLRQAGETPATRDRHLAWFLRLAETAEPESAAAAVRLAELEAEHDNFRAALRWAEERGAIEAGLRLGGALWRFWSTRGHFSEGRAWLDAFLDMCAAVPDDSVAPAVRAKALLGAGVMAYTQGDQARARELLEESLACFRRVGSAAGVAAALTHLATVAQNQGDRGQAVVLITESLALRRRLDDPRGVAGALHRLGSLSRELGQYGRADHFLAESLRLYRGLGDTVGAATVLNTLGKAVRDRGDYDRAVALHEESLALYRGLGDAWGISRSLDLLGVDLWHRGEGERAMALYEESLALARELGDRWGVAGILREIGRAAHSLGDRARANRLLHESLDLCRNLGDLWGSAATLAGLGIVALTAGDWDGAAARYREALLLARRMGVPWGVAGDLEGAARVAIGRGRPRDGVRLYGAACALRESLGTPLPPPERGAYEEGVTAARSALGGEEFAAAWAQGQALRSRRAIGEALAVLAPPTGAVGTDAGRAAGEPSVLTRRQREIVALVARGLTNRAIAAELCIAERTVDTHVANILGKLGLRSRTEVAAWASYQGLDPRAGNGPAHPGDPADPTAGTVPLPTT